MSNADDFINIFSLQYVYDRQTCIIFFSLNIAVIGSFYCVVQIKKKKKPKTTSLTTDKSNVKFLPF